MHPLPSTPASGASLVPVGKGHFLGHQGQCTGRAVPCIASHLVRLAGGFFEPRQQVLNFLAVSPDGCVRRAAEGWEREPGSCRKG